MVCRISKTPIHVQEVYDQIADESLGGYEFFVGVIRNNAKDKTVTALDFDCYEPMAIKEMNKITTDALLKFDIAKAMIVHRVGSLKPGDVAVIIAIAAAHRKDVFDACRYCIDTLKENVPIWKKEYYADGHSWVNARP